MTNRRERRRPRPTAGRSLYAARMKMIGTGMRDLWLEAHPGETVVRCFTCNEKVDTDANDVRWFTWKPDDKPGVISVVHGTPECLGQALEVEDGQHRGV